MEEGFQYFVDDLMPIWKLRRLRSISLWKLKLTDEFLIELSRNCAGIQTLKLCFPESITDVGLRALANFPNLKELDLMLVTSPNFESILLEIAAGGRLEILHLSKSAVGDEFFRQICLGCPRLHDLCVERNRAISQAAFEFVIQRRYDLGQKFRLSAERSNLRQSAKIDAILAEQQRLGSIIISIPGYKEIDYD